MNELSSTYDPKNCENRWRSVWERSRLFHADPLTTKPTFCVLMPPPNVTGNLHMGHGLDSTIQDILTRWKKMTGFETLWIPGTDHAGIATQSVVEKQLMKKYGKHRSEFTREEFLSHVWEWKAISQENITNQIRALGCACDWERLRFSMDEQCSRAVIHMFKKLFDDGLIYRGNYLVHWDCISGTALADDEVEYEEKDGFLWFFTYPIAESTESVLIATTRPETMLGDTAVAIHPEDSRYQHLIGKYVDHPITGRKIPIITDEFVDPTFGTGVVKITPAHDPNDYALAQRRQLPMISVITKKGTMSAECGSFAGMTILEAREAIISHIKELGLFVKAEPHRNRVGISYRSKAIIEPLLSEQWFVRLSAFKNVLKEYVISKKVTLIPTTFEHTYFQWIDNLRDWCISRQLWWGHRIPVWYRKDNRSICICYEGEGVPPEVSEDPSAWEQDTDVLDTWFSSAIWPLSTLGWPEKTPELAAFFPTSVLITGHDILFFWVARMIMMSHYALQKEPFHEVFLHGLIYGKSYYAIDETLGAIYVSKEEKKAYDTLKIPVPSHIYTRWEKMSKSKGNVLDPLEIIDEYGADAMRLTLASVTTHSNIIELDRRKFEEYQHFVNKLWNGSRFVFSHLKTLSPQTIQTMALGSLSLEDRWILSRLAQTTLELNGALQAYAFDKCIQLLYSFFWNDFCALYIELSKTSLSHPDYRLIKQAICLIVLENTLKLLHPFAPFITEELFSILKSLFTSIPPESIIDPTLRQIFVDFEKPLIAATSYPEIQQWFEQGSLDEFALFSEALKKIRAIRGEMKMAPQISMDIFIISKKKTALDTILRSNEHLLRSLVLIKNIVHSHEKPSQINLCSTFVLNETTIIVPLPSELFAQEKLRLQKTIEKTTEQLQKAQAQYEKCTCSGKTPPDVLETMKKNIEKLTSEHSLLQASLNKLNL